MPRALSRRRFLVALALAPFLAGQLAAQDGPPPPLLPDDTSAGITEGWTLAVLPDTQNYVKLGANQANLERMCRWIAEHRRAWRIEAALHEGDLVEQNDIAVGGGQGGGDQASAAQWASVRRSLGLVAEHLPVVLATGNHDYGVRSAEDRRTRFTEHFPLDWCRHTLPQAAGGILVETAPNAFGRPTLENAAYEIQPPSGRPILLVSLEWSPRKAAVEWARAVFARTRFAGHLGILLTHCFLKDNNLRAGQGENLPTQSGNPHRYATGKGGDTYDGEDLWNALVKDAPQIQLVLNGHEMGAHVGYRADRATAGHTVHQMLFNAQGLGHGNGGDGWLRLLTFEPDGRTLSVRTFSPLKLDAGGDAWWNHPRWRFTLRLS